jgi:hypothetical protein
MPKRHRLDMRAMFGPLLAALAVFALPGAPTRAATACLAAPNATAPQGKHWYYRSHRVTKHKCWYLAAEGQRTVVMEAPAEMPAGTVPKRSSSTMTSDQGVQEMSTQDRSPQPVGVDADATPATTYAEPPSPVALRPWPAPARPADTVGGERPAMSASAAAKLPAGDAQVAGATDASAVGPAIATQTVTRVSTRADAAVTPVQIVIAASAIAGGLLYTIVELALVWRRGVRVERRRAYPFGELYLREFETAQTADAGRDAGNEYGQINEDRLRQILLAPEQQTPTIAASTAGAPFQLPQRDRQPAQVGIGDQPDLPARQRQHGTLFVLQHDCPRPNHERGAGAGSPINAGDVRRASDVAHMAVQPRLRSAED